MIKCLSFLKRHSLLAGLLFLLFSCNVFTDNHSEDQAKAACLRSKEISKEQEQKIRASINADHKSLVLDTIFQKKHDKGKFTGCVLIAEKGVVLFKKSYGTPCVNSSKEDSLTIEHKFQLASVSKTFTAIATLMLYEKGKLSLDDSIQNFIPGFPYSGVTIKMLLNHRSGLPYYVYAFNDSIKYGRTGPDNETLIQWFIKKKPAPYKLPDKGFGYCNTNYILLAYIIEKVSEMPYEKFIREKICLPLGMKNTFVVTDENDSLNILKTCGHQNKREAEGDYFDLVVGDKGIYSTVEDMYTWYRALNSDCLLKKETLQMAFTPYSFESPGTRNYGLGFRMTLYKDSKTPHYIYHNGWWRGYKTLFWMIPEEDVVIIILGNSHARTTHNIKEILKLFEADKEDENAEDENEE